MDIMFLFAVILSTAVTTTAQPGKLGSHVSCTDHSCYLIEDTPTPKQADARAWCQRMGGDLAIIQSAYENEVVHKLLISQSTVTLFGAWLGFQRKKADSDFYWINADIPLKGGWGYTNWASNEPNDYRNIEDCVNMYGNKSASSGKWNDFPCDFTLGYNQWTKDDSPVILCQI